MSVNYIQFHIGDFLSGVMHMDAVEVGAYTMLIMAHYQAGEQGLPDDDERIKRITKTSTKVWNRIKPVVLEKFDIKNGYITHHRILTEIQKIKDKAGTGRQKQSEKNPVGIPKVDSTKCEEVSQNKNKSLKLKETEKTINQEPITNNQLKRIPKGIPKKPAQNSRGSRLPDDWVLPEDWGKWAESEGLSVNNVLAEEEKFKDYWLSVAGAKGIKQDWQATWRNWVRRSKEYQQ